MEKNLMNSNSPDHGEMLSRINPKERLYTVPPTYFEGLADEIMAKILSLGKTTSREMAYNVPKGYFEGFAQQVMSRILEEKGADVDYQETSGASTGFGSEDIREELSKCAPLLLSIGNANVYEVPAGYFNQFATPGFIPRLVLTDETTTEEQNAPVVAMTPMKKFWRTAVAAAAILGVLISGERYFNHSSKPASPTPSSNQYAATIQDSNANFQQHLSGLSDLEIVNYLKTPEPITGLDSISEKAAVEAQKAISGMTNEELETYLERTPATY